MRVCEGNVSIDRNVTVFGIKQANMQDNTPTGNSFNPGDNATLNVNMEIEDENAMHAVVSVRQGELQCQLSTVTVSGELNESFSQDQVSVENSFDNVSGVARSATAESQASTSLRTSRYPQLDYKGCSAWSPPRPSRTLVVMSSTPPQRSSVTVQTPT
jgi:hypothetical protein